MFRYEGLLGASTLVVPMVVGLLAAIFVPTAVQNPTRVGWMSLSAYVLGFGLFLLAKISVFRQGNWLSFGSDRMVPSYRWTYRTGYFLMGLGFLLTLSLAIAQMAVK